MKFMTFCRLSHHMRYMKIRKKIMELMIIRHGDPDYEKDSLTEKGWREAEYLSEKLVKMNIKDFYVSPLGRARDTASCTLKKTEPGSGDLSVAERI